jgi:hypothetical protein
MIDILSTAAGNVYSEGNCFIINANKNGRFLYLFLTTPFFLLALFGLPYRIYIDIVDPESGLEILSYLFLFFLLSLFGYMSISYLIQLINIKELVLIPTEKKVQVRLERNKKIVSEHSRDNISLTKQRVSHEEPYRASMKWFTVFDTSTNKQLFCIRPGTRETDGMAVEELTEFFNAVMYPEKNAKKQQQKRKEIEERNDAMKEKYTKTTDDESKWDSLS